MKNRISRVVAGVLAGVLAAVMLPSVPTKAEEFYTESYAYDLDAMKTKLLESEKAAAYSDGAVTFAGSSASVTVGSELVYHLFRQGNTKKKQTVTIVTQDITAGYGEDYELVVDEQVLNGKANVLLDGQDVTYDVYLDQGSSGNAGASAEEADGKDTDLAVDMEQVKKDASCTFDLTFEAGEQVKEIRVRAKMPEQAVGNKEFQLVICACQDGLVTGEYGSSVITLMETRQIQTAQVSLVEGSEEVTDGYVTVLVERTGNTNGYTSYDLNAEDGTAVNGEDYILSSRQLLFTPGVSLQRIHIPLVSADVEEEKTFTLRAGDSREEITYTTTALGASDGFTQVRGQIDISMHDFEVGSSTEAVDSVTYEWQEDECRYKFGFRSVIGGGTKRNASIRTSSEYNFTGVEAVKFSASYAPGTIAGDHLDVYVSSEDYALNEAMLGNLSSIGARYSVTQLTGQGIHRFSVNKQGEHYLFMTAEQHSGTGWIDYYLYNQEFDGKDEGHVALELKEYTLKIISPKSLGSTLPAGDVRLTLSTDSAVTGETVSAYRDEAFKISYTQMDESAHFVGYELVDNSYKSYYTYETESPVFTLTSDILESYADKFEDDTIIIRPIFEWDKAEVRVLKQDFGAMGAISLTAEIDEDLGKAVYKDGKEVIATIAWDPSYKMRSDLTFTVTENANYEGDYRFTAFKAASGSSSTASLTNPAYYMTSNDEWSITLDDQYYEITPIISNIRARLLLNVSGATHGTFDGEPEGSSADEYTVEDYDGHYNANDIVIFHATPDEGYRAKWSYRDVVTGETKIYYGEVFYYRVQVPMLMTDNYVSLEFEQCGAKKSYSVVADVYMQGGNLLHEPTADSDEYFAFYGAQVSLEGTQMESAEDGSAGTFTLHALPGETYTALVIANHRQYIQDVTIPEGDAASVRQSMKLSYYYEGPRVTSMQYYSYDGTVQNGDAIYLKDDTDKVILAAEIEKAGQEVTDVIYKLKDANGALKGSEVIAERNGSQYIWSASLGMLATEGDQIWIELVKQEKDSSGTVKSRVSYGEVNTGYTIVVADYDDTVYLPDTGVDQDVSSVPIFGSMYFLMGVGGVKAPTFTVSKSGGITYLTIGTSFSTSKLYHKGGEWLLPNTWTAYKGILENALKAGKNILNKNLGDAKQLLKKKTLTLSFNVSAQLALYNIVDEETKNSELMVVGAWMTVGVNGNFTYNYPFFIEFVPCFCCLTISGNFADTVEIYAKDADGYVALQAMHDPTKSSYKSENDFKMDLAFGVSVGVGVNGLVDLAGGGTGKFAFDWIDWSWGTVKFTLTFEAKLDLLFFGGTVDINALNEVLLNTNPYTQAQTQVYAEAESRLMDTKLSELTMRPFDSYQQQVNVSAQTGETSLLTAGQNSDVLISGAYDFSKPQMYALGNDRYIIVATVDSRYAGGIEEPADADGQSRAVIAYAMYDAASKTYETDEAGRIFMSLEPENGGNGSSINFHPSVTEIGNTGKYLILWNSVLYTGDTENLNPANARSVIRAAVYDSAPDQNKVVAYKSLVAEDDQQSLMSGTVLDAEYDPATQEVVVLYRALNLDGLDENSTLKDYAGAGSTLMCTSIRLDDSANTTFTPSVVLETGGKNDREYSIIKTADLAVMNGQPLIAYQLTKGEQANYISTAEEGSGNHIYVASLTPAADGGYALEQKKEVTEGISSEYNAQPQLLSYTMDAKTCDLLMWRTEKGMATLDAAAFMKDGFTMGAADENSAEQTQPNDTAEGTATIINKFAGGMGDYQIIQGADGKVYSIWTEGTGAGTKVMMAALASFLDEEDGKTSVSWGTGSCVFETTDNRYVCAMSPVVDSNGQLHLLYRDTAIGQNEDGCNIVLKTVNMNGSQLTVENYAGLSEEALEEYRELNNLELYVSDLYPKAGQTLTIKGRVKNSGVQATEPAELTLSINGVPSGRTVTIPTMASGIEDEFTFTYQVPDDYDGSPLEFSVSGAKGTKLVQSTARGACLEVSDMRFDQLTYLDDAGDAVGYLVTVSVTNTGNDVSDASTFVLSHIENGKENDTEVIKEQVFGSCAVPAVRPGEVKKVSFRLEIPKEYFAQNTFHLASVAGALYYNYNPDDPESQLMAEAFVDYVQAEETPDVQTLTLAKNKTVGVGQSLNLKVVIAPATAKEFAGLAYESSDPAIAAVDENGIVTGVKEGSCTITVTAKNGVQKKMVIRVTKDAAAEDDEEYDPSDAPGTDPDGGQNGSSDQNGTDGRDNAQTGDAAPLLPMVCMLIVSGAVIAGVVISKRKTRQ